MTTVMIINEKIEEMLREGLNLMLHNTAKFSEYFQAC